MIHDLFIVTKDCALRVRNFIDFFDLKGVLPIHLPTQKKRIFLFQTPDDQVIDRRRFNQLLRELAPAEKNFNLAVFLNDYTYQLLPLAAGRQQQMKSDEGWIAIAGTVSVSYDHVTGNEQPTILRTGDYIVGEPGTMTATTTDAFLLGIRKC